MSGFKLLAIRPLIGCDDRFLKNLQAGEVYQFYKDYKFLNHFNHSPSLGDDISQIKYKPTVPDNLYNVKSKNGNILEINISAIVGKNGSGKSAISEFILYNLFVISNKLKYIVKDTFLELNSTDPELLKERQKYIADEKSITKGLKSELFYLFGELLYKLKIDNGEIVQFSAESDENVFIFTAKTEVIKGKWDLNPFFYSMVVNYSFYAFNTDQIGMWIKAFFHKNDGYQMPIVINPYRNKGNLDINTETYLTSSRLLANILSIPNYKNINQKSTIDKIELYFDRNKDYRFLNNRTQRFTKYFVNKFRENIITPLFELYFNGQEKYPDINTEISKYAEVYLMQKLITIPTKYSSFKNFNKKIRKKESQNNYKIHLKENASSYVKALYEDRSHITLKVRQVLNFLRKNIYKIDKLSFSSTLELASAVKLINKNSKEGWFTELIDYLPPPFLVSRIRFNDKSYFEQLSSGEKQKIYSLNSIVYHLKNLDSVHKSKFDKKELPITYNCVNLIFDEIELYYHPEFQKNIIFELLYFIKQANYSFVNKINMIFLTHSPFILSDIPKQNIIHLDIDSRTGKSKQIFSNKQTFGANIHDLLADNFFLKDTLVGKYVDSKILELISKIKRKSYTKHDTMLLNLIGDKFLKSSIKQFKDTYDQDHNS